MILGSAITNLNFDKQRPEDKTSRTWQSFFFRIEALKRPVETGRSMLPKRCCVARVSSPDVVAPAQASAAEKVSLETRNKSDLFKQSDCKTCKTTYKVQSFV